MFDISRRKYYRETRLQNNSTGNLTEEFPCIAKDSDFELVFNDVACSEGFDGLVDGLEFEIRSFSE